MQKYKVPTALNGPDALQIPTEHSVQLIISEVMMDEMDGLQLRRTLKHDFEHSHFAVVLLTAKNTLQSKIEGQVQIASLLANRGILPSLATGAY